MHKQLPNFIYFSLFIPIVTHNVCSVSASLEYHNTGDVKAQLETQFSDRFVQLLIQL